MRILQFVAIFAALSLSLVAQGASYTNKADALNRGLKSNDQGQRLRAMAGFEDVEVATGVSLLLDWSQRYEANNAKLQKRIARDLKFLDEERTKRIIEPRMSEAKRQETKRLVEGQLAPVVERVASNEARVNDNLLIIEKLQNLVGVVFGNLDGDQKERGARQVAKRLDKTRDARTLVGFVRMTTNLDHPLVAAELTALAQGNSYPSVRVAALDALHTQVNEGSSLAGVAALRDDYDQVRFAAVLLLRAVGGKEAIPELIKLLDREKQKRLGGEIAKTLEEITNAAFGINGKRWARWWKAHGKEYEGRGPEGEVPGYSIPDGIQERIDRDAKAKRTGRRGGPEGNSFYGIETKAEHIVYVLDVSGSMLGGPGAVTPKGGGQAEAPKGKRQIDKAVAQLKRSILALPKKGTFNIVFYNQDVKIWRDRMQKSTKKNKEAAVAWADAVKAEGATNIFDSLEKAFSFAGRGSFDKHYKVAVETIFLLSDGSPNAGRFTKTPEILTEIKKLNSLAKIQIHTVSIGGGGGQGGLMRRLAQDNNGEFVRVD